MQSTDYQARFRTLAAQLRNHIEPAALLVSSARSASRTRDQEFSFRQDSDFYYLTGTTRKEIALLLLHDGSRFLFAPREDPKKKIWESPEESLKGIAQRVGAELFISDSPREKISACLKQVEILYYQPNGFIWPLVQQLFGKTSTQHYESRTSHSHYPRTFILADKLVAPLRLKKDRQEVKLIQAACALTNSALLAALPLLRPGVTERAIAAFLDYKMKEAGGGPAFETIVAFGKNAATLHHRPGGRTLRNGDLALIDWGAEHSLYAGDISRTIPCGSISREQRELYEIVLSAHHAAIDVIRPGVELRAVHEAASRVLLKGLLQLKIITGTFSKAWKADAVRKYFPHSIGHFLGIDVHDIGNSRPFAGNALEAGHVITIEPGLYFSRSIGKIPALGIRIEDDVLVTKTGSQILSSGIPTGYEELRRLISL